MDIDLLFKKIEGKLSVDEELEFNAWLASSAKHAEYFARFSKRHDGNLTYHKLSEKELRNYRREFETKMKKIADNSYRHPNNKVVRKSRHLFYYSASAAVAAIFAIGFFFIKDIEMIEEPVVQELQITPHTDLPIESKPTVTKKPIKRVHLITSTGQTIAYNQMSAWSKKAGVTVDSVANCLAYTKTAATGNISDSPVEVKEEKMNELVVERGSEFQLILNDDTKVWLNSDTHLHYPTAFTQDVRKVMLEGEAYFEVAKDSLHPFIVQTGDMDVRVYGTQFNVNTRNKECVRTTLIEGSVSVLALGSGEETMLTPGYSAEFNEESQTTEITDKDIQLYIGWKDGSYYFEDTRLDELLDELSRWYAVDFNFDKDFLKEESFTGCLSRRIPLLQQLSILAKTNYVTFQINGTNILVKETKRETE